MGEIRFGQIRAARRVLDLKERVVAGILEMPYQELRKGERLDSIIPASQAKLAREVLRWAERVRNAPGPRVTKGTRLRALLPFERPRCTACRQRLNVTVTAYSGRRGEHWYLKCPKCGRRFWTKDGRAYPVNPKGGNWTAAKLRVRCADCGLECSKRSGRYWECPRCRRRFREEEGRAVATIPGRGSAKKLPFLRKRNCPNCRSSRLWIKAIPRPPKSRHFYFRCDSCGRSSRFDTQAGRLMLLRNRKAAVKP